MKKNVCDALVRDLFTFQVAAIGPVGSWWVNGINVALRRIVAGILETYGGGKGLFLPGGKGNGRPPSSVVILTPGDIPTTNLYLTGRLEEWFGAPVRVVNALNTSPTRFLLDEDAWVVIVRHAPSNWLRWLESRREKLAGTTYLLDDDIPSALRARELPPVYAWKTAWRYARTRRRLARVCTEIWASTPELARRYASSSPRLWEPRYFPAPCVTERPLVYFYHGTWAHRREMQWLVPVVKRVQDLVPGACFEIMGSSRVRRMYRDIPRVRVVHPMSWMEYLAYAGSVRYEVGLAPCFDTEFNRARSHNKIFDITRLGGAGVYSKLLPYAGRIEHGHTGLLCENTEETWVTAIVSLLQNEELRSTIRRNAQQWCTGQSR